MRILLTNDDGVHSPGIRALAEALVGIAELLVVAPEAQQSASGHAITLHKPLRLNETRVGALEIEAYGSNGTPADCVILGVLAAPPRPDLVISGINAGANLGEEVLYSGTVSAAMEGLLHGIPAVAISVDEYEEPRFEAAAAFARKLVQNWDFLPMCSDCLLNVNVPSLPPDQVRGVKVARLGRRAYVNQVARREDPRGRAYYWFSGEPRELDGGADTDIGVVASGCISITPVHPDVTSYAMMAELADRVARLSD